VQNFVLCLFKTVRSRFATLGHTRGDVPSFPYINSRSNATVVPSAFKAMRKPLVQLFIT
jgi:hypothetical protein